MSVVDPARTADVEAFLYLEAELLDDRRFDEWLALYAADATYWIPQGPDADPRYDVQLMLDDRRRLRERVLRLSGGHAYSQDPPSRTVHLISNVRVVAEEADAITVASVQLVTEVRRNRQAQYAGRVLHELVRGERSDGSGDGGENGAGDPAGSGWLIRRKEIRLVNSDVPLGNVTFLI
jgi:3-phenylpropionate/cinnamic acid dioxygenase small subunit